MESTVPLPPPVVSTQLGRLFVCFQCGESLKAKVAKDIECVGKKKLLGGRLIATRQSTPCAPLSDVAEIHTDKTREHSLRPPR